MDKVLSNKTCFKEHMEKDKSCQNQSCRQWMACKKFNNCAIIASREGPRTLQQIGDLCGLTRMRICQIEKSALKKIREYVFKIDC